MKGNKKEAELLRHLLRVASILFMDRQSAAGRLSGHFPPRPTKFVSKRRSFIHAYFPRGAFNKEFLRLIVWD